MASEIDTYLQMIEDLRSDLGSPDLPFVAGNLGEFYVVRPEKRLSNTVNAALTDLPNRVERTGCASAAGLDHKGDLVHFGADGLRQFGKRYAAEMLRIRGRQP